MGQGRKVIAGKASKSSSGCKEAWRGISAFPFCLTVDHQIHLAGVTKLLPSSPFLLYPSLPSFLPLSPPLF